MFVCSYISIIIVFVSFLSKLVVCVCGTLPEVGVRVGGLGVKVVRVLPVVGVRVLPVAGVRVGGLGVSVQVGMDQAFTLRRLNSQPCRSAVIRPCETKRLCH